MAEQIAELRSELEAARDAARSILAGHATFAYEPSPSQGTRPIGCMCTGCQIARNAHLLSSYEADAFARDAYDGLNAWQVEAECLWKVCLPSTQTAHPAVCEWAYTRQGGPRGPFHEHLVDRAGNPVRPVDLDEVPF